MTSIENPQVDDIYQVNFEKMTSVQGKERKFGIMRVESVNEKGVELLISNGSYEKESDSLRDVKRAFVYTKEYYADEGVTLSFEELRQLGKSKGIYGLIKAQE